MDSSHHIFYILIIIGLLVPVFLLFYKLFFFNYIYGELEEIPGLVTDKRFEPAQWTTDVIPIDPEYNVVVIQTAQEEMEIDNEDLFNNIAVGEKALIGYQKRFKQAKFGKDKAILDGVRIIYITCPNKIKIEFLTKK